MSYGLRFLSLLIPSVVDGINFYICSGAIDNIRPAGIIVFYSSRVRGSPRYLKYSLGDYGISIESTVAVYRKEGTSVGGSKNFLCIMSVELLVETVLE